MEKDKLLRKVQGLSPGKRSTESLSEDEKRRYKREVGRSPDDRLYYVSAEKDKQQNEVDLKGVKRNLKTSQVELDGAQRIVGSKKDGKTVPDKVKTKVDGVRRTLKPSRK